MTQRQRFIVTVKSVTEYTHIHSQEKSKASNKKQDSIDRLVKHRKPKIISTGRIVAKAQTGKQNFDRKGNKTKNRYAKVKEVHEDLYTLKINHKRKRRVGKTNK